MNSEKSKLASQIYEHLISCKKNGSVQSFVAHEPPPLKDIAFSKEALTHYKVFGAREEMSREDKDYIFSSIRNTSMTLSIGLAGWAMDFSEVLTPYIIKFENGGLLEVYAPDKTSIENHPDFEFISGIYELNEES